MDKQQISRFLRFGFIDDIKYPEPIPIKSHKNEKEKFKSLIKLPKDDDFVLAYSGSYTGAAYLSLLNEMGRNTKIVSGKFVNNAMYVAGYFKSLFFQHDFGNLETDLHNIHQYFEQPRCMLGDIYVWNRQRFLRNQGWVNCLCEGGADSLLISHGYLNFTNLGFFKNEELEYLDLPPAPFKLVNNTTNDLFSAIHYWYNHNASTVRNNLVAEKFGTKIISPFLDEELAKFCLSLSIVEKYNKYILRNAVPLPNKLNIMTDGKIYSNLLFHMYGIGADKLIEKYLRNKKMKIFEILDFWKVQDIDSPIQLWQLLNLAIWFEVHS